MFGLLLFLSGALVALMTEHAIVLHHRTTSSRTTSHRALLNELSGALDLTPAQRDSVQAILSRHQSLVDSAWRTINHQLYVTMDSVHSELARVLEPEQTTRLHEWMLRHHGAPPPGTTIRH
jgi:hypothetical protein